MGVTVPAPSFIVAALSVAFMLASDVASASSVSAATGSGFVAASDADWLCDVGVDSGSAVWSDAVVA